MSINVGFYGTGRTYYNQGTVNPEYKIAKSHLDTTDGEGVNGTLSVFTRKSLMSLNELPDLSCCYTGIGNSGSGWTDYAYLNLFTGTPAATVSTENVPFFIADIGTVKPNAYWQAAVPILTNPTSEDADTSWGMGSTKTDVVYVEAGWVMDNTDSTVAPIVEIGGRAIRWLIVVAASAVDENGLPTGTPRRYTLDQYCAGAYEDYPAVLKVALVPHGLNVSGTGGYWSTINAVGTWSGRRPYTLAPVTTDIFTANGKRYLKLVRNVDSQNWPSVYYTDTDSVTFDCFPALVMGFSAELVNQQSYYSKASNTGVIRPIYSYSKMTVTVQNDHIYCYYMVNDINEFRDLCRRSAAYTGQFFTGSYPTAISRSDSIWEDPSMLLGTIEDNGLTYGKYTMGADNATQPQFSAEDMVESTKYDPEKPTPPTPSSEPVKPQRPGFSLAAAGCQTYAISNPEFEEIWDDIYDRGEAKWEELLNGLALFGANPLNAILAYRWMPFSLITTPQESNIILGNTVVNSSHRYSVITDYNAFYKQDGVFNYAHEKNFINSKHCKCRVWLPFYGFVELPMTQVLSKEIEIAFQYNAPDDIGVWIISFDNVIYDYYECAPYIEIPITGDNSRQIAIAKQQQAINTALTIGGAVLTIGAGVAAGLPGISAFAGMAADAGGLVGGVQALGWLASEAPLEAAGMIGGLGTIGRGIQTAAKAGSQVVQSMTNTANQIGTLATNVPTKAGAAATTFLHLPMKPYIQFYTNTLMETANISEYKKTVGIACEQWSSISSMPENSLLCISKPTFDTSGMTQNEVNMLVNALNGFFK